jgi:hypothetical protein
MTSPCVPASRADCAPGREFGRRVAQHRTEIEWRAEKDRPSLAGKGSAVEKLSPSERHHRMTRAEAIKRCQDQHVNRNCALRPCIIDKMSGR